MEMKAISVHIHELRRVGKRFMCERELWEFWVLALRGWWCTTERLKLLSGLEELASREPLRYRRAPGSCLPCYFVQQQVRT